MRKLITLIFVITSFVGLSQDGFYNGWGQRGNTLGAQTYSLGSIDNFSFVVVTNGTRRMAFGSDVANTPSVNVLGTFSVASQSSLSSVYIAAPNTATGLYIETDNSASQFPFIINAHSGCNAEAILQGTNNAAVLLKNTVSAVSWRASNDVSTDNFFIGESSNPALGYLYIRKTTGYVHANYGLRVGSIVAPTATLDVTGTLGVSSTATLSNSNTFGTLSSSHIHTFYVGSANTASFTWRGLVGTTIYPALYIGNITPSATNYALVGTGATNAINGSSSSALRVAGNNVVEAFSTGAAVTGTTTTSGTSFLNGTQLVTGGYSVTTKVIDATAGDAATINSPIGRFRKDATGTTFVLTNSQITANSVITLQVITAGLTGGKFLTVQAGAGSATITFEDETTGVATAPSGNMDVNFIIMN